MNIESLTTILIQGLLLLSLAMVIDFGFRRHRTSASTQDFHWRAMMIALVLVPLFPLLPKLWHLPTIWTAETDPTAAVLEPSIILSSSVIELQSLGNDESGFVPRNQISMWLLGIWAAGALWLLGRYAYGYQSVRRQCQYARRLSGDDPWCQEMGGTVPIMVSPTIRVPMVFGLWRPCLLLPESALAYTCDRRKLVVQHERAHLLRRDGLMQLVGMLANALHWPNPLVWWARHRLRLTTEHAIDDQVLEQCQEKASVYAALLSEVANQAAPRGPQPIHAMAQPSTLRTRVERLLNPATNRTMVSGKQKVAIGGSLFLALLLLGTVGGQDQQAFADHKVGPREGNEAVTMTCHVLEFEDVTILGNGWKLPEDGILGAPSLAGVFQPDQVETLVTSFRDHPQAAVLAVPKLITRDGQAGSIAVKDARENIQLTLTPKREPGGLIDLSVSFDPIENPRKVTTTIAIADRHSVAFVEAGNRMAYRLYLIQVEIAPLAVHETSKHIIILDPGHGGQDTGSVHGALTESAHALRFAERLRTKLQELGYTAILTRHDDRYVPLQKRADLANAQDRALFISLHFNASRNESTRGVETFYPRPVDEGPDRKPSALLAKHVQASIAAAVGGKTRNRGIRAVAFKVLSECLHPAITVEGGFITNQEDRILAKSEDYLDELAEGIVTGIRSFESQ